MFLAKANMTFRTQKIQLAQNDIIYLGSDGYKRQLKFNEETKDIDLIDIFREYANLSIEEQKLIYLKKYEEMVKLNGQLDDFCLIGIQF
jgi:serine phosphatase RsbU (regulator of sigma subunit)